MPNHYRLWLSNMFFPGYRVFDKERKGTLSKEGLGKIMKNKLSKKDIDEMIYEAIKDETDLIDYTGKVRSLYLLVYN